MTAVTNRTGTAYSSQNFKFIYIIIIKLYINMADYYNKNDIQMTWNDEHLIFNLYENIENIENVCKNVHRPFYL